MFNTQPSGGYLVWRLWPEQKVFMDGRNDVYYGKQANEDYLSVLLLKDNWKQLVDEKYGFNFFVLWYKEGYSGVTHQLINVLEQNSKFKLVYQDEAAVVLLRNIPENKNIIEVYALE